MKTRQILLVITGLAAGYTALAADPPAGDSTNAAAAAAAADPSATLTNAPAADVAAATNTPAADNLTTNGLPKLSVETNGTEGLRFNFRGAPLKLVLEHLVKAAGFILANNTADIRGTVEIWSQGPVTKDEAIELVGSALRNNGYAFSRHDRILSVSSMDGINHTDLPLHFGSKWEEIPQTDEVVIWVLPVKYANASQLLQNVQVLLPTSTTLTVNESANSIIIVGAERDIRRTAHLVTALDVSISGVTSIKVFQLHYADAKQLATEVTTLFSSQASAQGGNGGRGGFFNMFGGGGGRGGNPFGGNPFGGNQGNSGSGGAAAGSKVAATSDDYSNSLIVSASDEMMKTIEDMIKEIDVPTTDVTEMRVFRLVHADPSEIADQLSTLFPDTSRNNQNNNGGGFGPFRFMPGGGGGGRQATTSDRQKQKTQVMAVPDPRTGSLLVSAASEMMPHIAEMIEKLDAIDARHEVVHMYELRNADPQDVQQALTDLFNRNTKMTSANNSKSLLGSQNPLNTRATQNQQTTSSSSGFGSSSGGGRGGSSF